MGQYEGEEAIISLKKPGSIWVRIVERPFLQLQITISQRFQKWKRQNLTTEIGSKSRMKNNGCPEGNVFQAVYSKLR